MTISTDRSKLTPQGRPRHGFTMVEVLIAVTLMGLILAVSTSSLMFIAKSTRSMGNYQEMNASSRYVLEQFASDARMTVSVDYANAASVSMQVYNAGGGTSTVVYSYDAAAGTFSRSEGGVARVVLQDVTDLTLKYYTLYSLRRQEATVPIEVKEIQLKATMGRKALRVDNTNHIISARFMMRNKPVNT